MAIREPGLPAPVGYLPPWERPDTRRLAGPSWQKRLESPQASSIAVGWPKLAHREGVPRNRSFPRFALLRLAKGVATAWQKRSPSRKWPSHASSLAGGSSTMPHHDGGPLNTTLSHVFLVFRLAEDMSTAWQMRFEGSGTILPLALSLSPGRDSPPETGLSALSRLWEPATRCRFATRCFQTSADWAAPIAAAGRFLALCVFSMPGAAAPAKASRKCLRKSSGTRSSMAFVRAAGPMSERSCKPRLPRFQCTS